MRDIHRSTTRFRSALQFEPKPSPLEWLILREKFVNIHEQGSAEQTVRTFKFWILSGVFVAFFDAFYKSCSVGISKSKSNNWSKPRFEYDWASSRSVVNILSCYILRRICLLFDLYRRWVYSKVLCYRDSVFLKLLAGTIYGECHVNCKPRLPYSLSIPTDIFQWKGRHSYLT